MYIYDCLHGLMHHHVSLYYHNFVVPHCLLSGGGVQSNVNILERISKTKCVILTNISKMGTLGTVSTSVMGNPFQKSLKKKPYVYL